MLSISAEGCWLWDEETAIGLYSPELANDALRRWLRGPKTQPNELLLLAHQFPRAYEPLPKRDHGLIYNIETATAETIRDEDAYSGVRVSMTCQLATALLTFHVDINVGDPISPAPGLVEIPRLLGGSISVLGYPLAMVLAEKIATAIQRDTANTRWRAGADLYLFSGRHQMDGTRLQWSPVTVADPALVDEVDGLTWIPADRAWIR